MSLAIQLHSRGERPTTGESATVASLRERLESFGSKLKRLTIRVEAADDAARGMEHLCRVTVTPARSIGGRSFVVEGRAPTVRQAVDIVGDTIEGELRRAVERSTRRPLRRAKTAEGESEETPVLRAGYRLEAEEPIRPVSAKPRRGQHFHMTRHESQATSARELSTTARPSRKSTRKSANRSKRDSNLARRAQRATRSPESRAAARGG